MYKKIFIVDDDEFYLQMLTDHLSKLSGVNIQTFGTGEECLLQIPNDEPDLVILDFNLNDIVPDAASGLVILEKLKKSFPRIHVIMLSGQGKSSVSGGSTTVNGAEHLVLKDDHSFKNITAIIESQR